MAMTITPDHDTEFEPSGRRRKITKFALAGVAVLGVGAALTSAAWSDNVFFGGNASTADLDLQGRGTAGSGAWEQGDGTPGNLQITIPALENIGPGQTDTHTVEVLNSGTVDVYLNDISVASAGPLFVPGGATADIGDVVDTDTDRVLAPTETATIEVRVTGNNAWEDEEFTNTSGTITVTVSGTSDIPTP